MGDWRRKLSSLGYSPQPDYQTETLTDGTGGTTNDFKWALVEEVDVDLAREVAQTDLLEGSEGATSERYVGSRHGSKITIAGPLRTFHDDYDPTADDPLVKRAAIWGLIAKFFGSAHSTAVTDTAQAGSTSTTLKLAVADVQADDYYNNWIVEITGGTGSGQFNKIIDYVSATKVATVENAWETTPDVTSTYSIVMEHNQPANTSVYDANDVNAGAAGVSIVHVAGDYKGGDFYLAATTDATDNDPTMAWIFTGKSGAATLTVFEPPKTLPALNDETFPTLTFYSSTVQPQPVTMRLAGDSASLATLVLIGCMPESLTISLDSRQVPRFEAVFAATDYRWDNTLSGLQVPTESNRIPAILGTNNGRVTMGASSAAGSVLAGVKQCGLSGLSLSINNEIAYKPCHSAPQGVESASIIKRTTRLEFVIPHDSADIIYDSAGNPATSGQHAWSSYLELGTKRSACVYVGPAVGKCLSILISAGKVVEAPKLVDADGLYGYSVAIEGAAYTGDTDDGQKGAAGDSTTRIGIG